MDTFGDTIRIAREERGLLLRQVAAELEIDQAIISKYERGERHPSKEQVLKFARFYKIEKNKLMILWLADKVLMEIKDESEALGALKVAEEKLRYEVKIKKK